MRHFDGTTKRTTVGLTLAAMILAVSAGGCTEPGPSPLKVALAEKGLDSLSYDGAELLAGGLPGVQKATFRKADDTTYQADLADPAVRYSSFWRKLSVNYAWGSVACAYAPRADRLDVKVTVTNRSPDTLHEISMRLMDLRFPGAAKIGRRHHNIGAPTVIPAVCESVVLALCNEQIDRPLTVGFGRATGNVAPVEITAGGDRMVYDELYVRRPIAPGRSDTYEVSLRFGPAGSDPHALGDDVYKRFAAAHPPLLNWPDRRPITRLFFGGGLPKEKILDWYKDPNSVQLPTEATPQFKKRYVDNVARGVQAAKDINAQGIIIWDIEGGSFPHATTYIGDPRLTKIFNPEMDAIADELFKRITDAGLHAGVCIRPSKITYNPTDHTVRQSYGPAKDPFLCMNEKIEYCKKRWGVTIFYVDTNYFWRPRGKDKKWSAGMIQADVWKRLLRRHPDILLIPEAHYPEYMACAACYNEYDMGFEGSPGAERRIYPKAFNVPVIEDSDPYEIWDLAVRCVREGDSLMTFGYGMTRNAAAIGQMYTEAGYLDQGEPENVKTADLDGLLALIKDPDPRVRFYAAKALGAQEAPKAADALIALAAKTDEDWLVRKNAVLALGECKSAKAVPTLVELLEVSKPDLRYFAARALGEIGSPAAPAVLMKLTGDEGKMQFAIVAVGMIGDAGAVPQLQKMLDPEDKFGGKKEVLQALGQIGGDSATQTLIRVLERHENVYTRCAAAEALGLTHSPLAAPALKKVREAAAGNQELNHLRWVIGRVLQRMEQN